MMRAPVNERGSVSVFLILLLLAAIIAVGSLSEAAISTATRSYGYSVLDLAGRSVLSEYDRELRSRYGLFGLSTSEEKVAERLEFYTEASFTKEKDIIDFFRIRNNKYEVDLSMYALTQPDLLENQILQEMGFELGLELLSIFDFTAYAEEQAQERSEIKERRTERTLRNIDISSQLPSKLHQLHKGFLPDLLLDAEEFADLAKAGKKLGKDAVINLYIIRHFRDRNDPKDWSNTFFVNEIEYILFGADSDSKNRSMTKTALLFFRTAMNFQHIMSDADKQGAIQRLAAILTPGPEAIATQLALATTWAGAEAFVDWEKLDQGYKVPLIKESEDWAISLDNAVEGILNLWSSPAEKQDKGLSYKDHLLLFLFVRDRTTKLIRIMDLIQLNLIGDHDSSFQMSGCYSGFDYYLQTERTGTHLNVRGRKIVTFEGSHVY